MPSAAAGSTLKETLASRRGVARIVTKNRDGLDGQRGSSGGIHEERDISGKQETQIEAEDNLEGCERTHCDKRAM